MKKFLLILFISHFSLLALKAQGTWSPRDTLPDSVMIQGITGFSIGNYGYTGLGEYGASNTYFTSIWQFNPSTNSWLVKTHFPGSARVAPASFVIGNKAYLVTGSIKNAGTCVTECWEYDATTNVWTPKANFPSSPRTYAVGFAIGGKGYVGTGANEYTNFRNDFYAYDTATDNWTKIADFGGIARSCAIGFAIGSKGYVCFGKDSTFKLHNDIWEYDTEMNTWTQKTDNPGVGLQLPVGFVICNNIYVSGDSTDGTNPDHRFWKFNTASGIWTQEASIPGIGRVEGMAFAISDTGYAGFGFDSMGIDQNAFYKFFAGDSCNLNTSDNNIISNSEINIYPNPNKGIFTVVCNSEKNEKYSFLDVYNVFGENIHTNMLIQGNNTITIRNQPRGVYFYRIISQDRTLLSSGKFIVQ